MNDVTVYPTHCFILHFLLVAYETFGGNRVSVYKRKTSGLSPLSLSFCRSLELSFKKKDSSRMLFKSWVNGRCDRQLNTEKKCRPIVDRQSTDCLPIVGWLSPGHSFTVTCMLCTGSFSLNGRH